jgi:hypothetical protein
MQQGQCTQTNVSRSAVSRGFSFAVYSPVASSVCDVGGGGEVGLYSGLGFAGVLNCLIPVFFGFFFSRPRLSRLPMTRSFSAVVRRGFFFIRIFFHRRLARSPSEKESLHVLRVSLAAEPSLFPGRSNNIGQRITQPPARNKDSKGKNHRRWDACLRSSQNDSTEGPENRNISGIFPASGNPDWPPWPCRPAGRRSIPLASRSN